MKKIYLLLLVLATVFVACKKDRDVEFSTFTVEDEKIVASYTSMDLSCKVRCAATINEFYLQYDTVADFSTYQEVEFVENEKTEVYSVKIGDLLDNTTYYVRYVAVNSYSQVTSEEVSEFKTLQATAPTIEVREITDVLDTIATVGFVLKFNGGADVTKMGVCWSVDSVPTIDNTHVVYSIDAEKGVADGDSLVLNISGLKANTIYYVRAYAENKMGISYSVSKLFITLTLPEVRTDEITDIQLTSAVLNGEAIFDGNDTTTIYGFCWSEEENPTIDNQNIQVKKDTFSYKLSNLLDETKYYVRAYAKNKIGIVYGEEKEFVTKNAELPVVETSEVTDITYISAKVGGNVLSDGGAEVIERGICYSLNNTPTIEDTKVVLDKGLGSFSTIILDLQRGMMYYVRAYAINKKGISYGELISFTTQEHEYVDLGLSVKWATCNIGADSPEEPGDYFAWGEVTSKYFFDGEAYKYGDFYFTKYNSKDGKVVLDLEDDVANVKLGGAWRMPTREEVDELINNCRWSSTDKNGMKGYKIVGLNGNSIFLPAAGAYISSEGTLVDQGREGLYWTSSLSADHQGSAYFLDFSSDGTYKRNGYSRYLGLSIRPVYGKGGNLLEEKKEYAICAYSCDRLKGSVSGGGIYAKGSQVTIEAKAKGDYKFKEWSDGNLDNPRVITLTNDVVYIAYFEKNRNIEHEYVDLGLSVKWATCNVGAVKPDDTGDFFAWGETSPKEYYDWSTYKYGTDYNQLTKYCNNSDYGKNGFIDNKIVLDPEDDAATVNWGEEWRMPTHDELSELFNQCTWSKETWGYTVIGPNGNSIFLPATGYMDKSSLKGGLSFGRYRSSSLVDDRPDISCSIHFSYLYMVCESRYYGYSVRPVYGDVNLPKEKYTISVYSNDNSRGTVSGGGTYDEGSQVTIIATAKSGYSFKEWNDGNTENPRVITVTKDAIYTAHFEAEKNFNAGHEYVDLGLPSGLKWATCNVGATKPEEYGDYFAWGEIEPKEYYDWSTYKYCVDKWDNFTKYCNKSDYGKDGFMDNKTVLDPEDDAAHVNWGGTWRMPTKAEQDELRKNCTWDWITQNGVKGYKVTGPNGNSIFLPVAGRMNRGTLDNAGSHGYYWSSSLLTGTPYEAYSVYLGRMDWYSDTRSSGQSVRPVCQ